jgi:hypothetical protein
MTQTMAAVSKPNVLRKPPEVPGALAVPYVIRVPEDVGDVGTRGGPTRVLYAGSPRRTVLGSLSITVVTT